MGFKSVDPYADTESAIVARHYRRQRLLAIKTAIRTVFEPDIQIR